MGTAASRYLADHKCTTVRAIPGIVQRALLYPVLAILSLAQGLTAAQYQMMNFAWGLAFVIADVPFGVLADRIGRRPQVIAAWICTVAEMLAVALPKRWACAVPVLLNQPQGTSADALVETLEGLDRVVP